MGDAATKEKKRRPRLRWVLGAVALVVVVVVAVVALGGGGGGSSSQKKSAGGTLSAGKQQLLPLSISGRLAASPGQQIHGTALLVRSVLPGHGFWVGADQVNRVYVNWRGQAGLVGSKVNLSGTVKPAPGNTQKTLGLAQEDAAKVTAEAAYVNATKVSPAQ